MRALAAARLAGDWRARIRAIAFPIRAACVPVGPAERSDVARCVRRCAANFVLPEGGGRAADSGVRCHALPGLPGYTHNTQHTDAHTTPDIARFFLAPHSLSSHARRTHAHTTALYRSDTGGLWNVHKLSAKPDLPAVCYVASPKFTKPWATKRYLCVVTSDQRLQLLDPESAEGGFFAIDFRDWRVKTRDDSVLTLTRGDESLLWHIDRCVGVRCALPLGGEITRIQHYNGAVIITSRAVQVYTTHLVPLPFLADDGVNARRRYPKPVLDSIPFGTARILHTSSVPLDSALMPVGGDGAAPCFFAPHDGSLWRLSPDAQLALK